IWLLFCVVNSTYTSIWDIKMDWGLLQHGSQHVLLRDDIVFYRWTYYVAMPINILLRFAWTLNAASLGLQGEAISFMTAFLEAYRRIQWNFFRMENEHINNCGNFRAIKEIPLPFAF
ncbi:EXS family-domain-containing protein, partial [Blakeslea trispora]